MNNTKNINTMDKAELDESAIRLGSIRGETYGETADRLEATGLWKRTVAELRRMETRRLELEDEFDSKFLDSTAYVLSLSNKIVQIGDRRFQLDGSGSGKNLQPVEIDENSLDPYQIQKVVDCSFLSAYSALRKALKEYSA